MSLFKKRTSKIAALLLAVLISISLCSCGNDTADAVIRFEIDSLPATFDPQLAESYSELLAVRNTYEGLFRIDNDGNIVPALAASYEKSPDGLKYTFHLREDAQWKNETPLTAADFIFAFRRAADPITKSPFANTIGCIKNVSAALAGETSTSAIGVYSTDDHTLVIELEYENPDFLSILTTAVAMPCNEMFFNSAGGEYGLTDTKTLTNGSFKITTWNEKQIRMGKSAAYVGDYASKCAAVILAPADSSAEGSRIDRIVSGSVDVGIITDAEYETVQSQNIAVTSFEDISYMLVINPKSKIGTSELANVWSHSFNRQNFEDGLHDYLTTASSLIPSSLTLSGNSWRNSSTAVYDFSYTPDESKSSLLKLVKSMSGSKLPSITLLYPETPGVKDIASAIALDWQQGLGAYINISSDTVANVKSKISSGDYQMAIVPVTSGDNSIVGFLNNFVTDNSNNIYNYSDAEFDSVMAQLNAEQFSSSAADLANRAEQILADSPNIIPLAFGHTRYAVSSSMRAIGFSLTGGAVDFAFADKKS